MSLWISSNIFVILAPFIIILAILKFSKTAKYVSLVLWLEGSPLQWIITYLFESYRSQLFRGLKEEKSKDPERLKLGQLKILELGAGRGRNLKYFPPGTKMICIDPNRYFKKAFIENKKMYPNVELEQFLHTKAEDMNDIGDESIDVVVSTHVLCYTDDLKKALWQVKRVLVKGGKYYYLEHVAAPNRWIFWVQTLIEPVWKILASGCHITKDVAPAILNTGFSKVCQETRKVSMVPFFFQYHTFGVATK